MSVSFCLPHPVVVSAFMICRGLCACTEMLRMCLLCVSLGSNVRHITFRCVSIYFEVQIEVQIIFLMVWSEHCMLFYQD